jgi:ubiquinone/menaquinone biosynthesis C-methylase UbiE
MSTSEPAARPHDLLALMARRWQLGSARFALEVGAGAGEWGRLLLPHLAPEARVIGVDREAASIHEAHRRAELAGMAGRLSYRLGDADRLPFHDGVFDLVTCQTAQIHVRDGRAMVREMIRVLQRGGLVAVATQLGEGQDAIGDLLPVWFAEAGLAGVAAETHAAGGGVRYLVSARKALGVTPR